MALIMEGKPAAAAIRARLTEKAGKLRDQGVVCGLAVVLVGDDHASIIYADWLSKLCSSLGIRYHLAALPAETTQNEMLSLIHHIEKREKAAHPLKRIMWIEYQEDGMTITTTDFQLTRDIGDALLRAYKGDLEYHMNKAEELLYLRWYR